MERFKSLLGFAEAWAKGLGLMLDGLFRSFGMQVESHVEFGDDPKPFKAYNPSPSIAV